MRKKKHKERVYQRKVKQRHIVENQRKKCSFFFKLTRVILRLREKIHTIIDAIEKFTLKLPIKRQVFQIHVSDSHFFLFVRKIRRNAVQIRLNNAREVRATFRRIAAKHQTDVSELSLSKNLFDLG